MQCSAVGGQLNGSGEGFRHSAVLSDLYAGG